MRRAAIALVGSLALVLPAAQSGARTRPPPRIWFTPLPLGGPYIGSQDYFALFARTASWNRAARHVDVFKLYPYFTNSWATPAQMRAVIVTLKKRRIALGLEDGPLQTGADCGAGVEGFGGVPEAKRVASRIAAAGGTLRFVAFDEPYYYGSLYDGPQACHFSAEKVATDLAAYETAIKKVFPRAVFGDIEPVDVNIQPDQIAKWFDVYKEITGARLAFFHADVHWELSDWPQLVKRVEDAAHARGVRFGIIYNGGDAATDPEWAANVENRFLLYEGDEGGRPDDVIFQSWMDHPDRVLPETRPGSFTSLVDVYVAYRTGHW